MSASLFRPCGSEGEPGRQLATVRWELAFVNVDEHKRQEIDDSSQGAAHFWRPYDRGFEFGVRQPIAQFRSSDEVAPVRGFPVNGLS